MSWRSGSLPLLCRAPILINVYYFCRYPQVDACGPHFSIHFKFFPILEGFSNLWSIFKSFRVSFQVCQVEFTHVLEHEVDVLIVVGAVNIQQPDDVGMVTEVLQEHDLPEGPLRIRLVPESVEDLFDSHHTSALPVNRLPYYSVSLDGYSTKKKKN